MKIFLNILNQELRILQILGLIGQPVILGSDPSDPQKCVPHNSVPITLPNNIASLYIGVRVGHQRNEAHNDYICEVKCGLFKCEVLGQRYFLLKHSA